MSKDWLVIGIAGATCSGKTTLAERLSKTLKNSKLLKQDEYFLPSNDPRHTRVPELNHLNWELLTSLDIPRMLRETREILSGKIINQDGIKEERGILILEGFLIFNSEEIAALCDLRFFLDLNEAECCKRRKKRTYDPPDVPNYFEKIVWPEYIKSRGEILENEQLRRSIVFIDGTINAEEIFCQILKEVEARL
ncbi:nicotinamide riboside kinase 1 [Venturia canescens]|uniref:nicotinamide riboside kinase 1 n=1 Tax=Venturia canescens TaxID=32260 RepID=UPI001C9BC3BF|nr:nicotinamide riboside kinase 1 [Venturia canescens]